MKKINPYKMALDMLFTSKPGEQNYRLARKIVAKRIRWDCHPFSRSSRMKLTKLRNTNLGKKCIILCNGPSLLKVDFDEKPESYAISSIFFLEISIA